MLKGLNKWISILLACVAVLCSCQEKQDPDAKYDIRRVAVVLPMEGGLEAHWHRTLDLCASNLLKAQQGLDKGIKIEFEWYDELSDDLPEVASSLAERDDLTAIIGGLYSSDAKLLAEALALSGKPFFTPASTEQLVRAYSAGGNLWAMTETDITQCEVLLSKAIQYGARSVGLIADENSLYGKTFTDWFAFQAQELGLQHKGVWSSAGDIAANTVRALASGADYLICAPSEVEHVGQIIQAFNAYKGADRPNLLFSDIAYGVDVISALGTLSEGIEGVCFGSDPESGFDVAYEVYFGTQPTTGESQLYDACMLIGYACILMQNTGQDFRKAMRSLVDGREPSNCSWMAEDMGKTIQELIAGRHPDLRGASGCLDFDPKVYTNVTATVYANYLIYQQRYVVLDYNTTDGSNRADATLAGWNWKAQHMQEFGTGSDVVYPELDQRWALLVATSDGWTNYRHQVDVLNIYQMLKGSGYDDDHIVLIMQDDLAHNASNPEPGVLRSRVEGENVYQNVVVDYHTDQLDPGQLADILTGSSHEGLETVLHADADDNVLIFWSGHGRPGALEWLETESGFSAQAAKEMLDAVEKAGNYRKLAWLVETCFSGSVACDIDNRNRMLGITAANADETSKADIFNMNMGVWMSNRFTSSLQDCIKENREMAIADLYYRLFQNTVGSHVCIFGAERFGNLHQQTIAEWF